MVFGIGTQVSFRTSRLLGGKEQFVNHNRLPKTLLLALAVQIAVSAATISFVGVDGVSDGRNLISPFAIKIDGRDYRAMCYDLSNHVSVGQVWKANLLTINDLSGAYYFGRVESEDKYRKAGWYYSELMKVTDTASRIGIQHAAWLLFDSSAPTEGTAPWQAAAQAAARNGYRSVDFSTLRFIESVPGRARVQGLLVGGFPSSRSEVPEPTTWVVVAAGLGLLILSRRWPDRRL
jgi:hypothetical protein